MRLPTLREINRFLLRRSTWRGVLVGLICALAVWLAGFVPLVAGIDRWSLDHRFQMRGPRKTNAKVILVSLDDPSLDEFKKPLLSLSPELASVVTFLKGQGAAAIGIDLIIPEALSGFRELQFDEEGDASKLGEAIIGAGNVVLAKRLLQEGEEQKWQLPLPQWQTKHQLDEAETDLASVNLTEDEDQFVRQQSLYFRDKKTKELVMHFTLAILKTAHPERVDWELDQEKKRSHLLLDGERAPIDNEQKMWINFVGGPGSIPTVPFKDVRAAAVEAEKALTEGGEIQKFVTDFSGAMVVIGSTAESLQDFHSTPFSNYYMTLSQSKHVPLMSGPEIHTHVLATLFDRAFIQTPGWIARILTLVAVGIVMGMCLMRLNLERGALLTLLVVAAWYWLCILAFNALTLRLEMTGIFLLCFLTYSLTFASRWRKLRRMMGVVKSESITKALEADPSNLTQLGEERMVSVLFSDIRSFTSFSESHTPQEVVKLLNHYFSAVVPIIEGNGGTIDKYMGDGVMVIFGAPQSLGGRDPLLATRTAVQMVEKVHKMQADWARLGFEGMRIGVGVHTGKVIVGSVGSQSRLDYTAIGDAVNAASRIESENKPVGSEVLISSSTYDRIPPSELAVLGCSKEPIESKVKGKQQALNLYEIKVA